MLSLLAARVAPSETMSASLYNCPKCSQQLTVGCASPNDASNTVLCVKLRGDLGQGEERNVGARDFCCGICYEIFSSMYDREGIPMKPHHYVLLTKTWTMTTPVDLPTWMGEISQGSTPRSRATRN